MNDKFQLPARYGTGEDSVWVEYSKLAAECKPAVNLGQGFPDYAVPKVITNALAEVALIADNSIQQYARPFGHVRLVQALAKLYSPLVNREIDPMTEILIGNGAYECLYCAILGHVDKGDEVIVIEPFFDCYVPMIKSAGGIPRFISLEPKPNDSDTIPSADWVINEVDLTALFNQNTKMIILNSPHNPSGKVFKQNELNLIAGLCKTYNVICLSDEVYEWIVYKPNLHIRMSTLPDMWQRTITVGSAGKTFSATGWKIGWAYGPANLLKNLQVVHQNCIYTCCTPIQEALAQAFEKEIIRRDSSDCYFNSLSHELTPKRDLLVKALKESGFKPTIPEGGYFILADWSRFLNKISLSEEPDKYMDYKFTKKFAKDASVLAIPASAFYSKKHKQLGEGYVRFCFIKKEENLKRAAKLFKDFESLKSVQQNNALHSLSGIGNATTVTKKPY